MRIKHIISILVLFCCIAKITAQPPEFEPMTFQSYLPEPTPCLSNIARTTIKSTLLTSIAELKQKEIISEVGSRNMVPLAWPLRNGFGFDDLDFHGISFFVDHDTGFPNALEDYNCGERCFDSTNGFNHAGTDFFLWPFGWSMMHEGRVDVVAAADGVIIGKEDGNFDQNCTWSDTSSWNAVYIRHDDGSVAWYGHLKENSLTGLPIGASVMQGDFIGKVGSSGASSGPHLHFELYADDNLVTLVDPFAGNCNNVNTVSSWIDQRPYYDSGINRVSTHSAFPAVPSCPQAEIKNEEIDFCSGDDIFFMVFLRDLLENQTIYHQIVQPDGSIFANWQTTLEGIEHYAATYTWQSTTLPNNPAEGIWQYRVDFLGTTVIHDFNVCYTINVELIDDEQNILVYPNPTTELLQIESSAPFQKDTNILLHNVDGKLMIEHTISSSQSKVMLDLEPIVSGIYFLSVIENEQTIAIHRVVKI